MHRVTAIGRMPGVDGKAMTQFRRFAFFTLARDASTVAFTACMLMVAFSYAPAVAFNVGASVALVFSVALALRAMLMTEHRLLRSEVWRVLEPHERPRGEAGQQWARDNLQELLLRFSKAAAAAAIALYSSALVSSLGSNHPGHGVLTAFLD